MVARMMDSVKGEATLELREVMPSERNGISILWPLWKSFSGAGSRVDICHNGLSILDLQIGQPGNSRWAYVLFIQC